MNFERSTEPARRAQWNREFGLEHLFSPSSVLVVGASSRRSTPANDMITRQVEFGFSGQIFALVPDGGDVAGAITVTTIDELPCSIDYAFVAIKAAHVPQLVAQLAGRVRFIQVFSSGFREVSNEGSNLEKQMLSALGDSGTRIVGPNSWGIFSPRGGLTLGGGLPRETGNVALVSQSGAVAIEGVLRAGAFGAKFHSAIAVGNMLDVGVEEVVDWLLDQTDVHVIGIYCESTQDGQRLRSCLEKGRQLQKPIILLKGGTTAQGARAAESHTGALAGQGAVWRDVVRQESAVWADSIEELGYLLGSFSWLMRRGMGGGDIGRGVILVGPGGGLGVTLSDAFDRAGLSLDEVPAETQIRIAQGFPPGTSFRNPIDLPVYALQAEEGRLLERLLEQIAEALPGRTVLIHLNVHFICELLPRGPEAFQDIFAAVVRAVESSHGNNVTWGVILRLGDGPRVRAVSQEATTKLLGHGILVFASETWAVKALSAMEKWRRELRFE